MTDLRQRLEALDPEQRRHLAERLRSRRPSPLRAIAAERRPIGDFPLSAAQQRLWFLDQFSPGNTSYNLSFANGFGGPIDRRSLERALTDLVVRHEALRTTFPHAGDEPVQRIGVARPVTCQMLDLRRQRPSRRRAEAERFAAEFGAEPFDLADGPLFRAALVQLGEEGDVLVFVIHHIVADGWSMEVLFDDLAELYRAALAHTDADLAEPGPQYVDYTLWQQSQLAGASFERLDTFWRDALDGAPTLELPTDRPRPKVQSWRGSRHYFEPGPDIVERVRSVARRAGATPFSVLLANFFAVLRYYSGQDDLVVGTPVANRTTSELDRVVGFFVNNLVLRGDLSGDPSFLDVVNRTHRMAMDCFEHQDMPFSTLVSVMGVEQDLSRNPLFQVSFQLLTSFGSQDPADRRDDTFELAVDNGSAVFDLALNMVDDGQRIRGQLEYNTDLFDRSTIEALADHFVTSLDQVTSAPDARIADTTMLTDAELDALRQWERGPVTTGTPSPITTRILRQADATPDAVAAVDATTTITYRELVERSTSIADALHRRGGSGTTIAVAMPPSVDLMAALLGVLLSGNAYVPIDATTPAARLAHIVADAGATTMLVADDSVLQMPPGVDALPIRDGQLDVRRADDDRAADAGSAASVAIDSLAYVVYTSGSTGRPKGVAVTHRSLANYIDWCTETYPITEGAGAPLASSIAADMAVTTLFAPLASGAAVFLLDASDLVTALDEALRSGVTFSFVKLTPSHLTALRQLAIGRDVPVNTRAFIVGGEEFRGESIAPWRDAAPDILVWNEYGPSEATVACCAHVAPAGEIPDGPVPIGRPISNTVLGVVDGAGRRVPCGVVGELAIGGAGLAAGYVGDDALTARLFDGDGERRYRSGDLVKRDRGGVLTYLGRADRQLKIRGHRVEPGDVESVIGRHPGVLRCVVGARELSHDDRRLVAYVVIDGNDPDTGPDTGDEILAMVRRELPAAMVPSRIHIVDDIITTTSGKADLDALAHVITPAHRRTRERTAPRSALDRALVATFQDVLNHRDGNGAGIDIRDDFFAELGGDSLLATKVVARIRDYLAVDLPLRLIFEHPTAADLADALREAHDDPQAIEHRATALVEIMALSDNEVEASLETTDAHPRLDGGPSVNGHPSPNGHGQPNGMERRES